MWYCKLDATKNCFDYGIIIIFHIQLTVLMSFDFDLLGTTVVPSQKRHFSINFFVPNALLIQGWHSISVVVFCYNSPHYLPKIKKKELPNNGVLLKAGGEGWGLALYKFDFPGQNFSRYQCRQVMYLPQILLH